MKSLKPCSIALFSLGIFLVMSTPTLSAQTHEATFVHQLPANLEGGGDFSQTRTRFQTSGQLFRSPSLMANWSLSVGSAHYNFSSKASSPWRDIYHGGINLALIHPFDRQWSLLVSPGISAAGEADADAGDSLSYGLVAALNWQASETLRLGIGGGAFQNLEELEGFPLIIIDWQLAEAWRLANPLRAGVTGPAGLELSWTPDNKWTIGTGGAWRSFRFRLDDDAPNPEGVGEDQITPVWVRMSRKLPVGQMSLYLGALLAGELSVENRHGDRVGRQNYDDTPFGALYFTGSF